MHPDERTASHPPGFTPKPDARESPGGNPLIVWNQPHPIHLAELLYRNAPTPGTLARYKVEMRPISGRSRAARMKRVVWSAR